MAGIELRRARVGDAAAVAHVHRLSRAWYYGTEGDPEDGREALWSGLLAEPGRSTLLAEAGDEVIGFVSSIRVKAPVPALELPALELTALYVLPDRFGVGVGTRLYDGFESDRRDDEAGRLEVWEGNARAIGFYRSRGWSPTPERRPGPDDVDFVTYRLAARRTPG